VVLGFELKASCFLGSPSTTWVMPPAVNLKIWNCVGSVICWNLLPSCSVPPRMWDRGQSLLSAAYHHLVGILFLGDCTVRQCLCSSNPDFI
jgi:hypothetical protein